MLQFWRFTSTANRLPENAEKKSLQEPHTRISRKAKGIYLATGHRPTNTNSTGRLPWATLGKRLFTVISWQTSELMVIWFLWSWSSPSPTSPRIEYEMQYQFNVLHYSLNLRWCIPAAVAELESRMHCHRQEQAMLLEYSVQTLEQRQMILEIRLLMMYRPLC